LGAVFFAVPDLALAAARDRHVGERVVPGVRRAGGGDLDVVERRSADLVAGGGAGGVELVVVVPPGLQLGVVGRRCRACGGGRGWAGKGCRGGGRRGWLRRRGR